MSFRSLHRLGHSLQSRSFTVTSFGIRKKKDREICLLKPIAMHFISVWHQWSILAFLSLSCLLTVWTTKLGATFMALCMQVREVHHELPAVQCILYLLIHNVITHQLNFLQGSVFFSPRHPPSFFSVHQSLPSFVFYSMLTWSFSPHCYQTHSLFSRCAWWSAPTPAVSTVPRTASVLYSTWKTSTFPALTSGVPANWCPSFSRYV